MPAYDASEPRIVNENLETPEFAAIALKRKEDADLQRALIH